MIKSNELRIGNIFNPIIHVKVEAWMLLPESEIVFEPIPLTEEWLIRFGFVKLTPKGSIYGLEDFHIQDFYPLGFFECSNHIKIKHVHQLQNLYFALTGNELELK